MIAHEIQLQNVIRDKIQSETKFSPKQNTVRDKFSLKKNFVRKKFLSEKNFVREKILNFVLD